MGWHSARKLPARCKYACWPGPLFSFTLQQWPKLHPNTHTHTRVCPLLFKKQQLASLHVDVSHRLSFSVRFSPLSSFSHSIRTPAPLLFQHHLLPLWLILNSSPLGYFRPRRLRTHHPPSSLFISERITCFWGGRPPPRKQVSNEYRPL